MQQQLCALLLLLLLRVEADETCSNSPEKEVKREEKDEEGSCGCNAATRSAFPGKEPKGAAVGEGKEAAVATAPLSQAGFRNKTASICVDGSPFYEGFIQGCFLRYQDSFTGSEDCGEVKLPGGRFLMGSNFRGRPYAGDSTPNKNITERFLDNSVHGSNPSDAEYPAQEAEVGPYYIDRCEVTNGQFKRFVEATGHKTDAELYGWSFVLEPFIPPAVLEKQEPQRVQNAPWWRPIEGAQWNAPEGPGSSLGRVQPWYGKPTEGVPDAPEGNRWAHPVSHVSWRDAYYFCRWRGKRLPSEAEWEFASRGGKEQEIFPWGDQLYPGGKHLMNHWQGDLPTFVNTAEDGWRGTSPAASYPPNNYGLYDMTGNIWEWVADDFDRGEKQPTAERVETQKTDEDHTPRVAHKTKRGGSHMCHASTCNRYRNAGRTGIESDSSTGNLGFRCARDV